MLFANELSFHEQFQSTADFHDAFSGLMAMRRRAQLRGLEIHCKRCLQWIEPVKGVPMQKALQGFPKDRVRSAMIWLTQGGPFFEDVRQHTGDHYLECCDDIVTDSSVGETAYRLLSGLDANLVSAKRSSWDYDPVIVTWRKDEDGLDDEIAEIRNWRDPDLLDSALEDLAHKIESWGDLRKYSIRRFRRLTFSDDCFDPLFDGTPFANCAAQSFVDLFGILDKLAAAFNDDGEFTDEGHRIYKDHFMGDKAWFSDSSEGEKHAFKSSLTFPHPDDDGKTLFCTWHGKVSHMVMRLHFSWPIRKGKPVYIVYAGPKITKK